MKNTAPHYDRLDDFCYSSSTLEPNATTTTAEKSAIISKKKNQNVDCVKLFFFTKMRDTRDEEGPRVPLKTILQNFLNHVENLEARKREGDDAYEKEFQVRIFW